MRRPHRPDPGQGFLGGLALSFGRVHELCGPARWTAALMVAQAMTGPILWVRPAWDHGRLHGGGLARFVDPGRLIFVDAPRVPDVLWTLEEALRSGAVPLVVGELPGPVGLTPMRRMQLACEAGLPPGEAEAGGRGLGLLLTPEGISPGAESRWRMAAAHRDAEEAGDAEGQADDLSLLGWTLTRERDRKLPPQSWPVAMRAEGAVLAASPDPQGGVASAPVAS
ncbi:hypothetical protein KJP29_10120 [Maritimibacter sp. DP1N21-5]|nr:hypothetical protein [Maritimibacter sp. DP1N21-5]